MKISEIILETQMPVTMQRQFAANPALKQAIIQAYARLGSAKTGTDADWTVAAAKAIDTYSTQMDTQLSSKEKADMAALKANYDALAKQVTQMQKTQSTQAPQPEKQPSRTKTTQATPSYGDDFYGNQYTGSLGKGQSKGVIRKALKALNPMTDIDTTDAATIATTGFEKGKRIGNKIFGLKSINK